MSYIKSLEAKIALLETQKRNTEREITDFKLFLCSAKFVGEEGGERKDWISTTDVQHKLNEICNQLYIES